jgi:UDP-GlcNAc:undecaprenyl-phosphate GlcNAc-1-phosphate transferase
MGIKDDLSGVNASTKFLIQFIVATYIGYFRRYPLYQYVWHFRYTRYPYITSAILSILFIIFIINAFNLIDGIDGLAGTT